MDLDDREAYLKEKLRLLRMPLPKLQRVVGDLHQRVYEDNDIEAYSYHRLASSVLIDRTKTGSTLIYHLKNFIGMLVVLILISMFKY